MNVWLLEIIVLAEAADVRAGLCLICGGNYEKITLKPISL
jgi:hypothetical protein